MFEYDDFTRQETRVVSLGTGYFPASDTPPSGILQTIGWTTSTLLDSSEDWVDNAVERQWPGILTNYNPLLPRDIDEADLSAIPELLEVGKRLADGLDWKKILADDGGPVDFDLDSQEFAQVWNEGWPGGPGVVLTFRVESRDDVDRLYRELASAGYRTQQAPYDTFWGARFAIVADPDGNSVGLMSHADPGRATPPPPPPSE